MDGFRVGGGELVERDVVFLGEAHDEAPGFADARERIGRLPEGPWIIMGLAFRGGAWVRSDILAQGG